MTSGVVYVAIGAKAKQEAQRSIDSLNKHNNLPITILDQFNNSRWAKLNIDQVVPYDRILYLDADTRIHGDITNGFRLLDNWDMAIAPSKNQGGNVFGHIRTGEKLQTIREVGYLPLQLQAGVMFLHRDRCAALFEAWRQQWQRWKDQDQAALIRALAIEPVRVWLLSNEWNGGGLIEHLFGRCR